MASEKPKVGPTAYQLIAEAPSRNNLKTGIYLVEYVSIKGKIAKKTGNEYFEHTLAIKDDPSNNDKQISILSSRKLSKGRTPEYNTKLYTLVTSLLRRDISVGEQINDSDLVGKRCKIFLDENRGACDVKGIFREDADIQVELEKLGVYGLPV